MDSASASLSLSLSLTVSLSLSFAEVPGTLLHRFATMMAPSLGAMATENKGCEDEIGTSGGPDMQDTHLCRKRM